jgi:ADP-ribose diphosphatase
MIPMNDANETKPPTIIDTKLLAESWQAKIFEDTIQYLLNRTAPYWRFEVPNFALAIGVRGDGKIPLVKQYRHGAGRFFWEFPAGLMEENEAPSDCVKREFSEEVGYELLDTTLLSKFYPYAGRSAQVAYIYSGRVGDPVGQKLDAVEHLEVAFVEEESIFKLLSENISASHLLAYLLYRGSR